jgi:hypothetical protein
MINPNQRIVGPFGSIFTPNTSATDKLSAQLYAEQKAKEAQDAKDAKEMDDSFAKNIAGVREKDIPKIVSMWQDYKNAKMKTYGNSLNNADRIKTEQNALKGLGNIYQAIKFSKETQNGLLANAKSSSTKPTLFRKDTPNLLSNANNLTSEEVRNFKTTDRTGKSVTIDLTNPSDLAYPIGSTDYTKAYDYAIGKKAATLGYKTDETTGKEFNASNDPYQNQRVSYVGIENTAPVIAQKLSEVNMKNGSNAYDFISENPHLDDPNYVKDIEDKYNAIVNSPEYKAAHKGKQLEFPSYMYGTDLGKAYITKAKELVVNSGGIKENVEKPTRNESAFAALGLKKQQNQFSHQESMARLNDQLIKGRQVIGGDGSLGYRTDEYMAKEGLPLSNNESSFIQNSFGINGANGYVPANKISLTDYGLITGQNIAKRESGVEPIQVDGKDVFITLENGDWVGLKNGKPQVIGRESVRRDVLAKQAPTKFKMNNLKSTGQHPPKVKSLAQIMMEAKNKK